jgi:hypothetical protein
MRTAPATTAPVTRPGAGRASGPPTRAVGIPARSYQAGRPVVRQNNILGPASSAPRPSWELPKNVTPHWEIPSYNNVQPNYVQGNPRPQHGVGYGAGYGVGYFGFPYYADSTAFVDAGSDDSTGQTAQDAAPARPDYVPGQQPYPPQPYAGQPYPGQPYDDQGYPPYPQDGGTVQAGQAPTPQQRAAAESDGLDHPEVTLIFNDGRPPKKVHSYVLTRSSVFVAENGHQSQIPLSDLDLPATIAQNRDAGVDFQVPGKGR